MEQKLSQSTKLLNYLSNGQPKRTDWILRDVYGDSHLGIARVGARVWDLKKKGYDIRGWKAPESRALYYYQLIVAPIPPLTPPRVAEEAKQPALV